jgi:aminoglycoside phosphotransferase (APT) family kinase protein
VTLPFVARPPGDPREVAAAARAAAEHWGLPDPVLMRTGMNALFAAGDEVVLRIGRPTVDAAAAVWLAAWLGARGITVPRFAHDEPFVVGDLTVLAQVREHPVGTIDWAAVGAMVATLHSLSTEEIDEVSAHYPTPWCASFPWWDFDAMLADVGLEIDLPALAGIERAVALGDWTSKVDRVVLCHGDVHPGNVIATSAGPVLLDWDLVCLGPAAWDHGPLLRWTERWGGATGSYESFAKGYGRSFRGDDVAEALSELRLVAATLMRVRAGRTDPAAADEAERRLRYWRGDPGAPLWNAA